MRKLAVFPGRGNPEMAIAIAAGSSFVGARQCGSSRSRCNGQLPACGRAVAVTHWISMVVEKGNETRKV
jgi:hypothetical protein